MNVVVTGAAGALGRVTMLLLQRRGHRVRGLDVAVSQRARRVSRLPGRGGGQGRKPHRARWFPSIPWQRQVRRLRRRQSGPPGPSAGGLAFTEEPELVACDITVGRSLERYLREADAVVHLAAVIPPRADREPQLARLVNVEGTRALVRTAERVAPRARFVFTSSVAVYGDRMMRPFITEDDEPAPNQDDVYGQQKLEAETIVRESTLRWTVLRLSYIVDPARLVMDPLLFSMPPETALEPCHCLDAARAIIAAVESPRTTGETLLIAGGPSCRIVYRDYLDAMFRAFGLGGNFLPPQAFSEGAFHCAFMDTARSERLLNYQRHSLPEILRRIRRMQRVRRLMTSAVRPLARTWVLAQSPFFRDFLRRHVKSELRRLSWLLRACLGLPTVPKAIC